MQPINICGRGNGSMVCCTLYMYLHVMVAFHQDNYFEEAFKMRNVLEEFVIPRRGQRRPTILGLREHIFTGRLSFHLKS